MKGEDSINSASTLNISKPRTDIKECGGLSNVSLDLQGLDLYLHKIGVQ